MVDSFKRLFLGIALIAVASGILLYSDLRSRNRSQQRPGRAAPVKKQFRVALVEHASQPALEDGVRGVTESLATRGYSEGGKLLLRRYNAEGDWAIANSIAKDVVSGNYDLIITISTPSLQTVANANKFGSKTPHVFGLVSDPYSAGVGINPANHLDHPPYMTGYGTLQPVADAFKMARQTRPELKTVGLVWNPTEANSQAQTRLARAVCAELGITLLEANAENTIGVAEAANSLAARGVEAFWLSGDVTVLTATDALIAAARHGKIPVFTVIPPMAKKGALFDLGANYFEIGKATGNLAADVLDGKRPAEIPVENLIVESLVVNRLALEGLKDPWQLPDGVVQRATTIIDATGTHSRVDATPVALRVPLGRNFKIGLAYFAPEPSWEICVKGLFDGLRKLGLEEGKNLEVRRAHAQAEIPNIPAMLQNFDGSDVDVIVAMTTPVISGAGSLVKRKPVVLTYCSDPVAAGAGQNFTNHLSHMTGIGTFPPVQEMVDVIRGTLSGIKTVGTIYNASEANSRKVVEVARELFAKAGIKLEETTVSSSSDVLQAAQALVSRRVQAFYIQGDNTVAQAFDVVVKAANDAGLPLFNDDPDFAARGAVACVGVGYYESGLAAARPIVRVLLGESPAGIPIENVSRKRVLLNEALAKNLGLTFPPEIVAEAAKEKAAATSAKASAGIKPPAGKVRIDLIEYLDTPNVELSQKGVLDAFQSAGWQRDVHFELRLRNAQGDMATLSSLVDAAVADTELIIACTTPALQGSLRRGKGKPLVFTLVASPILAGAGRSDTDHLPFVTGSYVSAPFEEGLRILKTCLPNTKRIGTLYVPGEVNSVYYKEQLEEAAKKLGLELETLGVSSSGEVPDGALALCGRNIDVFTQISDNLTGASFVSIGQAAKKSRIPLMAFAPGQLRSGAFMSLSRDFYDNGLASGHLAMRVLSGENPAQIPFEPVRKTWFAINLITAAQLGITIPESLLRSADEVIR